MELEVLKSIRSDTSLTNKMFRYQPYSPERKNFTNPIISSYAKFMTMGMDNFGDYRPRDIPGEYGGLAGVKHNVWPLIKFLGMDLVYEITSYTRLQTCQFMRHRALFRANVFKLQYEIHCRIYYLIIEFQNIHPEPLIWIITLDP